MARQKFSEMKNRLFLLSISALLMQSCGEDTPDTQDNFNRKEVVVQVADQMVIPSYADLNTTLAELETDFQTYTSDPTSPHFAELRTSWLESYLAWQDAALWNFGPAEDQGLITAMNIYPADTTLINNNLQGSYDLNSISQIAAQGFPALEYLLYSSNIDWTDAAVQNYFEDVLSRMKSKANATASAWGSYRDVFVNAEGTDKGSALGILFNHTFLPYLEVHMREAKFGIPGGQRTGTPSPQRVEGFHSRIFSKQLAQRSFEAYRRAWMGMSHVSHNAGPAIIDYVKYMDGRNGTSLEAKIIGQLDDVQLAIDGLDDDFYNIAQTNPQQLNDVWVKYQLLVFTVKTEVSSALNVTISYVDSDGD